MLQHFWQFSKVAKYLSSLCLLSLSHTHINISSTVYQTINISVTNMGNCQKCQNKIYLNVRIDDGWSSRRLSSRYSMSSMKSCVSPDSCTSYACFTLCTTVYSCTENKREKCSIEFFSLNFILKIVMLFMYYTIAY